MPNCFEQGLHLGVAVGVQPLVRDPGAGQELPNLQAQGTEARADEPGGRRRSGEEHRAPRDEGGQNGVAQPGIGGDEAAQPLPRDHDDLAGIRHAGRHEDAQAREHVQLPEEPAGPVLGDDLLFASVGDHHLDRPGHHDHEVVGQVAFPVEVLARGHRPPRADFGHDGHVGVGQGRKCDGVIGHRRASSGLERGQRGQCDLEQFN